METIWAGSNNSLIHVSLIREWAFSMGICISDLESLISHDLFPQLAENIAVQSPLLGGRALTLSISHLGTP